MYSIISSGNDFSSQGISHKHLNKEDYMGLFSLYGEDD